MIKKKVNQYAVHQYKENEDKLRIIAEGKTACIRSAGGGTPLFPKKGRKVTSTREFQFRGRSS